MRSTSRPHHSARARPHHCEYAAHAAAWSVYGCAAPAGCAGCCWAGSAHPRLSSGGTARAEQHEDQQASGERASTRERHRGHANTTCALVHLAAPSRCATAAEKKRARKKRNERSEKLTEKAHRGRASLLSHFAANDRKQRRAGPSRARRCPRLFTRNQNGVVRERARLAERGGRA